MVNLDLAIDSLNVGMVAYPTRSAQEDAAEAPAPGDRSKPGKRIVVNDLDLDNDGFPDCVDGFGAVSGVTDLQTSANSHFVPLVFSVSGTDDDATVTFTYPGSDPANIHFFVGDNLYVMPSGSLRVWTKDGSASRSKATFSNGGDYLAPGTYTIGTLKQRGILQGDTATFFVEAVKPSTKAADLRIKAALADSHGTSIGADEVALTSFQVHMTGRANGASLWSYPVTAVLNDPVLAALALSGDAVAKSETVAQQLKFTSTDIGGGAKSVTVAGVEVPLHEVSPGKYESDPVMIFPSPPDTVPSGATVILSSTSHINFDYKVTP